MSDDEGRKRFLFLYGNIKGVREEAAKVGKDPLALAREKLAEQQAATQAMQDVVRVLGSPEVTCPVCRIRVMQVCVEVRPTTAEIVRGMEWAWWEGYSRGRANVTTENFEHFLSYCCEDHKLDFEVLHSGKCGP